MLIVQLVKLHSGTHQARIFGQILTSSHNLVIPRSIKETISKKLEWSQISKFLNFKIRVS